MILAQGWKNGVVEVLIIQPINTGWSLYTGTYDPTKGQTFETATFRFRCTTNDLTTLLKCDVLGAMMEWADHAPGIGIKDALDRIQNLLDSVTKTILQPSPKMHPPWCGKNHGKPCDCKMV